MSAAQTIKTAHKLADAVLDLSVVLANVTGLTTPQVEAIVRVEKLAADYFKAESQLRKV